MTGARPIEPTRPRVAVIILNWNGVNDTLVCLASMAEVTYDNFSVLVVDNGSSDGSEQILREALPDLPLLQTGANLGYAGGNNAGIRQVLADAPDYVLLLNNDTLVAPDFLDALVDAAEANPAGGYFGPAVLTLEEVPRVIALGGANWDPDRCAFRNFGKNRPLPSKAGTAAITVDYPTGCSLLIRRQVLDEIGLMDERYFLTFEESDWCFRGREAGFLSFAVPGARIQHKVSVSFGGAQSPLMRYFMTRNVLYWGRRHLATRQRWRLLWKTLGRMATELWPSQSHAGPVRWRDLRSWWWACAGFVEELRCNWKKPSQQAMRLGLIDFLRRHTGDCPSVLRARSGRDCASPRKT